MEKSNLPIGFVNKPFFIDFEVYLSKVILYHS